MNVTLLAPSARSPLTLRQHVGLRLDGHDVGHPRRHEECKLARSGAEVEHPLHARPTEASSETHDEFCADALAILRVIPAGAGVRPCPFGAPIVIHGVGSLLALKAHSF